MSGEINKLKMQLAHQKGETSSAESYGQKMQIERYDLEKENIELRQANADKFRQLEALKKQINDLHNQNKIVGKDMVDNLLEMMAMIRNAPNDVTRNHCLDSTITALKETQSAAQRILDKDK